MKAYEGLPRTKSSLDQRLREILPEDVARRRMLIAIVNVIVAQMLPSGVVKGGTALKLRVGERGSRFTPDLDAARAADQTVDDYVREFENRLATGWHGFTATVVRRAPADPENVPADYVMQPFDLKVSYRGKSILTVTFELGHDEIGSTATPTYALADDLADDLADIIVALGFPRPEPVPVLAVEFQVAQKLHACTTPERGGGNARSHDLVDLQILLEAEPLDPARLDDVGRRLFAARRVAPWPPDVQAWPGWDTTYAEAADGLNVRPLADAVAWMNGIIAEAVTAGRERSNS